MSLDAESYLQTGSNELRILEYTICGQSFGINILKVQKIVVKPESLTSTMNAHPSIMGIFKDNDVVIPLIDLGNFLGMDTKKNNSDKKVIVTEFFGQLNGFLVDSVEWIHHFYWENVINANDALKTISQKYVISIVKPDGERMIPLLDYETIILELCPNLGAQEMEKTAKLEYDAKGIKILIAEDSPAVRNMLALELTELGFEVVTAHDGKEAYKMLENDRSFKLVISDIEMPQMDGLALTCAIRNNPEIEKLPVIVYSSIGDVGMKSRAEFLNADAHVTKLNIDELLENVVRLTGKDQAVIKTSLDIEEKTLESESESLTEIPSDANTVSADTIINDTQTFTETSAEMESNTEMAAAAVPQKAIAEQAEAVVQIAESPNTIISSDEPKANTDDGYKSEIITDAKTITINSPHRVTILGADNVTMIDSFNKADEEEKLR